MYVYGHSMHVRTYRTSTQASLVRSRARHACMRARRPASGNLYYISDAAAPVAELAGVAHLDGVLVLRPDEEGRQAEQRLAHAVRLHLLQPPAAVPVRAVVVLVVVVVVVLVFILVLILFVFLIFVFVFVLVLGVFSVTETATAVSAAAAAPAAGAVAASRAAAAAASAAGVVSVSHHGVAGAVAVVVVGGGVHLRCLDGDHGGRDGGFSG